MGPKYPLAIIGLVLFMGTSQVYAEPRLPALIGDHMVLQREKPVVIHGWGDEGQKVSVDLAGRTAMAVTDHKGRWEVTLPALEAGGPYEMTVSGGGSVTVHDIWVGEVWVAAGQSNMAFQLKDSKDAHLEKKKANVPGVRFFEVEHDISFRPNEDLRGYWRVCSPEMAMESSALAYHFGKGIHQALQVPVGLIVSAWGSTVAESWTPRNTLSEDPTHSAQVARWCDDEKRFEAFSNGSPFDLWWSDMRLMPENAADQPLTVGLLGNIPEGGVGGLWIHFEKTGSTGTFDLERGSLFGARSVGHYRGELREGGWGTCSTRLLPRGEFLDLTPYRSLEFRTKCRGPVLFSVNDSWSRSFDPYDPDIPVLGTDWKVVEVPVKDLQRDRGDHLKSRFLDKIQTLALNVHLPFQSELPTFIYNGMIAPLTRTNIRGVLWYQGESNLDRAANYHGLLSLLIKGWREAWGRGDMPFLIVQLPNYGKTMSYPSESRWAELREAQRQVLEIPNTGLITTIDLGEADDIHPKNKADVGKRAVLLALDLVYHGSIQGSGPRFSSCSKEGGAVILEFTCVGKGLQAKSGGEPKGFALAGKDGRFHWARARIVGKKVVVWSGSVPKPTQVRYGWADNPLCDLYNQEGLPASPFRARLGTP